MASTADVKKAARIGRFINVTPLKWRPDQSRPPSTPASGSAPRGDPISERAALSVALAREAFVGSALLRDARPRRTSTMVESRPMASTRALRFSELLHDATGQRDQRGDVRRERQHCPATAANRCRSSAASGGHQRRTKDVVARHRWMRSRVERYGGARWRDGKRRRCRCRLRHRDREAHLGACHRAAQP